MLMKFSLFCHQKNIYPSLLTTLHHLTDIEVSANILYCSFFRCYGWEISHFHGL